MPRNMSFSQTTEQMRARTKSVTRRIGWENLTAGEFVMAIEKGQGLRKGEKVKPIGLIRIVSVRRERLNRLLLVPDYGASEMTLEGFPPGHRKHDPRVFVTEFWNGTGTPPGEMVTRIEFEFVE